MSVPNENTNPIGWLSGIYTVMSNVLAAMSGVYAPLTSVTLTNVASSASNVTLIAANANLRLLTVFNDSTAILYLKYGATASTTSYTVRIAAGGYFEMPQPIYTGVIDGIWASANGSARITAGV